MALPTPSQQMPLDMFVDSVLPCRDWCGVGPIVLGMKAGCLQVLLLVFALGHCPQPLLRLYCSMLLSETIERTKLPLHCAPGVFPCSLCLPCLSFGGWLLSFLGTFGGP